MDRSPQQLLKPLLKDEHLFALLEEYVAGENKSLVTRLISCNEMSEVKHIQGQIKALTKLIDLRLTLQTDEKAARR
jgi:hypothetical protein